LEVEVLFTENPNCFLKNGKPFPVFIDYYLQYCIERQELKITITGSKVVRGFWQDYGNQRHS